MSETRQAGTRPSGTDGGVGAEGAREVLARAVRACRPHLAASAVFAALIALLYLTPSLYMMQVYDRVMTTGGLTTLAFVSLVLVAALATLAALESVRQRILARASLRLDRLLAPQLMRAAFAGGREDARSRQSLRELDQFRAAFVAPTAVAVLDAPFAPLFICVCALVHPMIGGLALGGCGLLVLLALLNDRALSRAIRLAAEEAPRRQAAFEADAGQGEAARALGMGAALSARALRARAEAGDQATQTAFVSARYAGLIRFVRLALQSAALGLGALLAVRGQISPGSVIAGSILAGRAFAPMEQIVQAWRQIGVSRSAYGALVEALGAAPLPRAFTPLPTPKGAVTVEAVSMRTPDGTRLALDGISFALKPGEALGVLGASGAGKSTLARVLSGAATPDVGAVRLDGARLRDWDPAALGRHVGYLPQTVALFAGTVGENIARLRGEEPGADVAALGRRAVEAAMQAGAHEMIQRLPGGYDYVLGPRGAGVSAGQAQRIALARALFGGPSLLVLDEPNAHLDAEGEAALIAAIGSAKQRGASVVLVTHRAGVLAAADHLLVLNAGVMEALGPRDAILARLSGALAGPRSAAQERAG